MTRFRTKVMSICLARSFPTTISRCSVQIWNWAEALVPLRINDQARVLWLYSVISFGRAGFSRIRQLLAKRFHFTESRFKSWELPPLGNFTESRFKSWELPPLGLGA